MKAGKNLIRVLLFAANLLIAVEASAQSNYLDSVFSANENIHKFHFQSADSVIKKLISNHPSDYLTMLLSANYYWWLIISGMDTTETRNAYFRDLDKSLALLEHGKKKHYSNDSLYGLITTFAFKARIYALNYQYFSALAQLNNSIDFLKQSFGKENKYEWFLLTSGIYYFYIEAIKRNYPFLIPYLFFLPEGNMTNGIALLERASASENILLSAEASYFLIKIYLEEEKKYSQARKYSENLIKKYPENILFRYYQFKTYMKEKNIHQATKELGLLKYYLEKNPQLSEKQKLHFEEITKADLQKFYMDSNRKP